MFKRIARALEKAAAKILRVPPPKVIFSVAGVALSPKFPSLLTASVPPLIIVPP